MTAPDSDLLKHFRLLLRNRRTEFNKTWQCHDLNVLQQFWFIFFNMIGRKRWPPGLLIGWDIFAFFFETAKQKSKILDRNKDPNILYKVFVFRVNRENKMKTPVSDWLRQFRILLWKRWTKFNETWQKAIYQFPFQSLCFFGRSSLIVSWFHLHLTWR